MQCPRCQHENAADAKFCDQCATPLATQCVACGSENAPDAKFCNQCATPLTGTALSPGPIQAAIEPVRDLPSYTPPHLAQKILTFRSALEGERKQVTVFFCDIANSTPLAERLGPERMHHLLNQFFELALDTVHRYEGTINQFLGDGFMAISGAPIAHEDHARRAVLTALALQRTLKEANLGEPYEVECVFRMGLHSGLVVVASIGDNLRMDYTAVGDTTNLASRLQQQAAPGEILVSESTSRLVQSYVRLEALEPVQVKGKTEPLAIYRVVGTLPRRSPVVSRSERTLSQFVGRERELETLEELFAQVKLGQGQVVGIVAEAGGGKSRLLYEFRQHLQDKRVTYLAGRCLSYGNTTPYHPIIDIVRNNCGITETDSPDAISEKLYYALQEVEMDPQKFSPYLLHLLGVKEGTGSIAVLRPETIRTHTFDTLIQMSLQESQQCPLIVEIEDLHWCDKTSEDYLASLVENLAGVPILLLFTYRPGYHPPWIEKSYTTQISLRRLTPQDGSTIIHSVLDGNTLPDQVKEMIIERAEGNPFFLEELTRAVVEHRDLQVDMMVPDTIQGVLSARIDRLPEKHKRLLQTASVLGREFSPNLLGRLWEGPDSLQPLLLELKRLEFLFERTGIAERTYVFKHALIQQVAYESLLTVRRQALHAAAGHALEALYAGRLEDAYDRLAYHYACTEDTAKAVEYLTLVAERATRNSAYVEAIHHLTKGLELIKTLPAVPERLQKELTIQTMLALALRTTKGYAAPEVERTYARARELCQQVGETSNLFPVLWGLAAFYLVRAELQTACDLGKQLLSLGQRQHDIDLLLEAHLALGMPLFQCGELPAARQHFEQGIALYNPHRRHAHILLYGQDPGVLCRSYLSWGLWFLGYPDRALATSQCALTLAQEADHPFSLIFALAFAARVHQCRREEHEVKKLAESMMTLAHEQGLAYYLAQSTILRGWALSMQGQEIEGINQMRQGLRSLRATGTELGLPGFLIQLAEGYWKNGQPEMGLAVLAESLDLVDKLGVHCWEAEQYRLKGELLLALSSEHHIAAEACFRRAIKIADRQQVKSLELRAALSLSRLWQRQRKQAEARHVLAEIYHWFTEGSDTNDLKDAEALLRTWA